MPTVEAVVQLERVTGIPADRAINTFHFLTDSSDPDVYGPLIEGALIEFYDADVPSPVAPIDRVTQALSAELTLDWTLVIRDADPTPPRPVLYQASGSFVGPTDLGLPAEVAVALSYKSVLVNPLTPGRYRGRVFVGPVNTNTITSDTAGVRRPNESVQEVLGQAGDRLSAYDFVTDGFEWGVYSRVGATFSPTVEGWVDNAYDTIRSRGPRATSRLIWPS